MSHPRPRVLVIAEAANPEWVSVPLVGWSLASALREVADVHLVTQVRNRAAIERAGLVEGVDFTAIDTEALARPITKLTTLLRGGKGRSWTTATAAASLLYLNFGRKVWQRFGDELKQGKYDIVHRVTPLSPTSPSPLASRCRSVGVPFVVGPLNGGVAWPKGFEDRRRKEREWLSYIRDAYKLLPGYRAMRRDSAAIICGSIATLEQMPADCRDRCHYIPENAIDPARFGRQRTRRAGLPLKLAFLGRLVPYKGADMLIQAVAPLVGQGKVTLDIYGDGPEKQALAGLIQRLGVGGGVTLHGWVDHKQVASRLVDSDVLASPSIREFGGGVVLEAMAIGLCPVIADYAGPAELVTPSTGVKVAMGGSEQLIAGFRTAIQGLAADPGRVDALGKAGLERVRALFTWSKKAEQVATVYDWVLGRRDDQPMMTRPWGEISPPAPPASVTGDGADSVAPAAVEPAQP